MAKYSVAKRDGLWWVLASDGYDAIAIGYDLKKEAVAAMKVRKEEDAERAARELFALKEKALADPGLAGDRYRAGRITIEQYEYLTKEWK